MKENFEKCLRHVFNFEGGFSNDPNDRGGETLFGITAGTLAGAYKSGIVKHNNIEKLTTEEAKIIYKVNYWDKMLCDELPDGLDFLIFDMGINAGRGTAIKHLQNAINRYISSPIVEDGGIGLQTISALNVLLATPLPSIFNENTMLNAIIDSLLENYTTYYSDITDGVNSTEKGRAQEIKNRKFIRGWVLRNVNRGNKVGT